MGARDDSPERDPVEEEGPETQPLGPGSGNDGAQLDGEEEDAGGIEDPGEESSAAEEEEEDEETLLARCVDRIDCQNGLPKWLPWFVHHHIHNVLCASIVCVIVWAFSGWACAWKRAWLPWTSKRAPKRCWMPRAQQPGWHWRQRVMRRAGHPGGGVRAGR